MCGLLAVWDHPRAVELTYLGLFALQHRGQESAGISVSKNGALVTHRAMGLTSEVFSPAALRDLKSSIAIGHVRYSTTGSSLLQNAQPLMVNCRAGHVAIAHNGNLTNSLTLRKTLEQEGAIFQTTADSEIILHLLARHHGSFDKAFIDTLGRIKGAYSLVVLRPDKIVAARDPLGFRPLYLGRLEGGAYAVASETCALDTIKAEVLREIEPGEVFSISEKGLSSAMLPVSNNLPGKASEGPAHALCVFELIYFARPDSSIFGFNVHKIREEFGRILARSHPVDADLVMDIPDSGTYAALGFSKESGIPFERGFVRSHYIGRTFIQPLQADRELSVNLKLTPVKDVIRGKRVVVIDDSIVRGNTSHLRVSQLKEAGAKEVHMRISSPPIRHPCFFGIDFPQPKSLVANQRTVEEIRQFLEIDSLAYLSVEEMLSVFSESARQKLLFGPSEPRYKAKDFCTACFSGRYPMAVESGLTKEVLEESVKSSQ